jgi:PQQ-dependent catabolism-associated CXXCW motif protein
MRRRLLLAACAALLLGAGPDGMAADPPEPPGYRMEEYRASTPATLLGADVLTTDDAHALWARQEAAFIDVLPQPPRPPGLPASTLWHPKSRFDIPGSIWLPDTGYGALAPVMEGYLERGLAQASDGDRGHVLVFYCLRNCWMSWNAAKRAMALGYTRVAWYRDGTDGWEEHGFPLEAREPMPRPSVTE